MIIYFDSKDSDILIEEVEILVKQKYWYMVKTLRVFYRSEIFNNFTSEYRAFPKKLFDEHSIFFKIFGDENEL